MRKGKIFMDNQKIGVSPIPLEKVLTEEPTASLENRWNIGLNAIFSSLSGLASSFFISRVKSEDVTQAQSHIQRIFRKTDYLEKIKSDANLQNAFLLGYCHGFDEMVDSFSNEIAYQQNEPLKSVISSYRDVEPILRILDQSSEISHKDLAEQLGISESALSNLMKKVERYHIFNFTRAGKNKYYSLAHPNGAAALKIVKENSSFFVDSYTEFLLLLISSLRDICMFDELGKEHVMKKCGEALSQFTTRPAVCKQELNDLILILKSERVYSGTLPYFEKMVKRKVTIFTKDPESEKDFLETISRNIMNKKKDVTYQWFFVGTEAYNSAEKAKDVFLDVFLCSHDLATFKNLKDKVQCYFIPEKETEVFENTICKKNRFEKIYDVVIYDENRGFICEDETISNETPYIRLSEDQVKEFNEYIDMNYNSFDKISIG